jgi:hypothetical protein
MRICENGPALSAATLAAGFADGVTLRALQLGPDFDQCTATNRTGGAASRAGRRHRRRRWVGRVQAILRRGHTCGFPAKLGIVGLP